MANMHQHACIHFITSITYNDLNTIDIWRSNVSMDIYIYVGISSTKNKRNKTRTVSQITKGYPTHIHNY